MRLRRFESYIDKCARLSKWHLWFAWHPVRVGDGDVRWLEVVERLCRPSNGAFRCKYRLPVKPTVMDNEARLKEVDHDPPK